MAHIIRIAASHALSHKETKAMIIVLASITVFGGSILSAPAVAAPAPRHAPTQNAAQASIELFYEALEPRGDWLLMDDYGWVWAPYVPAGWRPYTVGRWVYTDAGCTWDSDEPWGWATYHYGRWLFDANLGWAWVPGDEWAPAWVSWRYGGGYIGWAPLPPAVGWNDATGLIAGNLAIDEWIPPFWYCFADERSFFSDHVRDSIALSAYNEMLARATRNVTGYAAGDHRVIERGLDITRIERGTGQKINQYRIVDVESREAECQARVNHGEMAFYRPAVSGSVRQRVPRPLASDQSARSPVVLAYILKWQDEERRALDRQQQANCDALKRQHQQELASPPGGISLDELARRQRQEQRALQEQNRRERQMLETRQSIERAGGSCAEKNACLRLPAAHPTSMRYATPSTFRLP